MAPEQARGRPVDRRADVWALGAVLFEMLTGRRLYEGETATETIAQIITQPPNFDALPKDTPAAVRRILRRCLEKDPRNRIQAAGDVRLEIDESRTSPDASEVVVAPSRSRRQSLWPWMVAALLAIVAAAAAWKAFATTPPPAQPVRVDVRLGAGEELIVDNNVDGALAVLSPDGRTLVYRGTADRVRRLFVRPLDSLQSRPLAGTEEARSHFFSPDGRWVAFFADGKLKKVSLAGGAPVPLATAVDGRGGSWSGNDTIVFSPNSASGLVRVPAAGGEPVVVTTLAEGERSHRWPWILPAGNAAIFIRQDQNATYDDGVIEAVRIDTGERKVLVRGGTFPRYILSGHLIFVRQNTVFAVPFDARRLEVTGDVVPVFSGVLASGGLGSGAGDGSAQLAFSDNGSAVFVADTAAAVTTARLAIVDRGGKRLYTAPDAGAVQDPRFSPDGSQLAYSVGRDGRRDIFILDIARSSSRRLTFDGTVNAAPVWSPDGTRVAYFSDGTGRRGLNIFVAPVDGSSQPEALTTGDDINIPAAFRPDGLELAFMQRSATGLTARVMRLDTKAITSLALSEDDRVVFPRFSPDGRWIAYSGGDRPGQPHVLVRPYPGPGGQWQISEQGGSPVWTKGGRELVFLSGPGAAWIMSAAVDSSGNAIKAGPPTKLLDLPGARPQNAAWFDASLDGSQFAVLLSEGDASAGRVTHVTFVFNLFDCSRGPASCVLRQ